MYLKSRGQAGGWGAGGEERVKETVVLANKGPLKTQQPRPSKETVSCCPDSSWAGITQNPFNASQEA